MDKTESYQELINEIAALKAKFKVSTSMHNSESSETNLKEENQKLQLQFESKSKHVGELLKYVDNLENQLRLISNNSKDIIFRYAIIEKKFTFLNQAIFNILEYTPNEFYNNSQIYFDLILDEWKESFLENWENTISGKQTKTIEYQIYSKSKDIFWLYQNSKLIVDRRGKPIAIEGSISNTTIKKQAELNLKRKNIEYLSLNEEYLETNEELRNSNKELINKNEELKKSEIRFRSLFENMSNNVAIFEVLDDGNEFIFKNFNSAAEKLENTKRQDIIGKKAEDAFPGLKEYKLLDAFKKVWKTKKPVNQPIIVKDESENLISWTENFIYRLPSDEIVVIYDDISNRKIAEIDLLKTKERYRIATEETKVAVWERDLKRNIGHVDPVLFEILGYPIPTIKDSFSIWKNYIHPEDIDKISSLNQQLKLGEIKELSIKFRAIHKNGTVHWFIDRGVALRDETGNATQLIGTISDITQQQLVEEELILAKEKAEEADNLKSTFLANMSHEVRTPMNGILGFTDLLQSEDATKEERKNYIEIIHKSGRQLMNIINDILDISKIEVGQIQIHHENVSVNQILDENHFIFKPDADRKKILLKIHKELPDNDSIILTDGMRLRQILINLINNALKFTNKGYVEFGYLLVPSDNLQSTTKHFLEFYIKDTGIGIPNNKREIIFDRFRQTDESHTRKFGGTGLGLAICKGFVDLLGGKIWHESEENKGSIFYFTIPYKIGNPDQIEKIETKFAGQYSWKGKSVLIVEDDDISYHYLKKILAKTNISIERAITGIEAIEYCKKMNNYNLVLMDIQLPGINGYEATRRIRMNDTEIPIIAQTAHALSEDKNKSLEAGCNDYITKPIKRQKLFNMMHKYLKEKKTLS